MSIPDRLKNEQGKFALVDTIPFKLPVSEQGSPCLMAVFTIDAEKAKALLPGRELFPLQLGDRGLLVITVINYLQTVIGQYVEFSIAIACTHGDSPAPPIAAAVFMQHFGTGQFVIDLPVSSEISVKGGRGIWGMPKHQANLDFTITQDLVSSQYDQDGQLCVKIEIDKPELAIVPVHMTAVNYAAFRGLLFKSSMYFNGKAGIHLFKKGSARLWVGDHPRVQFLKELQIDDEPVLTAFLTDTDGMLDDHFEGWFLTYDEAPEHPMPGMESVVNLGLSQEWLAAPTAPVTDADRLVPSGQEGD